MVKYETLHQRNLSIHLIEFCPTKDLVSIVTAGGNLKVYRTITWEKVYSKKTSDLAADDATIIAIAFSVHGKYISVAFSDSSLILLNLETGSSLDAKATLAGVSQGVRQLQWLEVPDQPHTTFNLDLLSQDFFTPNQDNGAAKSAATGQEAESVFQQLSEVLENASQQLLVLITPANQLVVFAFGLFPIVKVDLDVGLGLGSVSMRLVRGDAPDTYNILVYAQELGVLHTLPLHNLPHLLSLTTHCLILSLLLPYLDSYLTTLSKKFTTSLTPLLAKLAPLTTLLTTYQSPLPVHELMATACMCGLWHPLLETYFSTYWNEAGLSRMRGAVGSAGTLVVRGVRVKVAGVLTDCVRLVERQLSLLQSLVPPSSATASPSITKPWAAFLHATAGALVLADECVAESQTCRSRLLDLLDLIKDFSSEAAGNSTSNGNASVSFKPDLSLRSRCLDMFSTPMASRPPTNNPEHLTCSFLFRHLQAAPAAGGVKESKIADNQNELEELLAGLEDVGVIPKVDGMTAPPFLLPHVKAMQSQYGSLLVPFTSQLLHLTQPAPRSVQLGAKEDDVGVSVRCGYLLHSPVDIQVTDVEQVRLDLSSQGIYSCAYSFNGSSVDSMHIYTLQDEVFVVLLTFSALHVVKLSDLVFEMGVSTARSPGRTKGALPVNYFHSLDDMGGDRKGGDLQGSLSRRKLHLCEGRGVGMVCMDSNFVLFDLAAADEEDEEDAEED